MQGWRQLGTCQQPSTIGPSPMKCCATSDKLTTWHLQLFGARTSPDVDSRVLNQADEARQGNRERQSRKSSPA